MLTESSVAFLLRLFEILALLGISIRITSISRPIILLFVMTLIYSLLLTHHKEPNCR